MKTIQDRMVEIFDKYIGQCNTPLNRKIIFKELNREIFSKINAEIIDLTDDDNVDGIIYSKILYNNKFYYDLNEFEKNIFKSNTKRKT